MSAILLKVFYAFLDVQGFSLSFLSMFRPTSFRQNSSVTRETYAPSNFINSPIICKFLSKSLDCYCFEPSYGVIGFDDDGYASSRTSRILFERICVLCILTWIVFGHLRVVFCWVEMPRSRAVCRVLRRFHVVPGVLDENAEKYYEDALEYDGENRKSLRPDHGSSKPGKCSQSLDDALSSSSSNKSIFPSTCRQRPGSES